MSTGAIGLLGLALIGIGMVFATDVLPIGVVVFAVGVVMTGYSIDKMWMMVDKALEADRAAKGKGGT